MLIDFRLRPPFSGYADSGLFRDIDFHVTFARRFGFQLPESVFQVSLELMLKELTEADIEKAVIPARKLCNVSNDDLVTFIGLYPDKFYGMAGVDPLDGEKALEEIQQYVIGGPCAGITIEPGYCAEPLKADDERIMPIYQLCEVNDIPIFLSFGGIVNPLVEFNNPEIIDRIAARFPKLTIILAHGGYPYVAETCFVCFKNENIYLLPDFYVSNTPCGDQYLKAARWIPDKILFGSAYPAQPIKEMLEFYRAHLSPEAFEQITYKNAAKILKLRQ